MEEIIDKYPNHIILDKLASWPNELIDLLAKDEDVAKRYINLEDNTSEYFQLIKKMRIILCNKKYLGFHCSKLINEEMDEVVKFGLDPVNSALTNKKLKMLFSYNFISEADYILYKGNNNSDESGRKGLVFTSHELETLKCEDGLKRFFRCWGGESFYYNKEDEEIFSNIFSNIGTPVIVFTSHNFNEMNNCELCEDHNIDIYAYRFEKCLVNYYLDRYDHKLTDLFWKQHGNKIEVIDIVSADDPLFEKLTNFSQWNLFD